MAVKAYPGSFTWAEAKTKCSQDGTGAVKGRLATPHSLIENDWFHDKAKELDLGLFWLGVNDVNQEGLYRNGYGGNQRYFNWADNQPKASTASSSDCVDTGGGWNNKWNDADCNEKLDVLCTHVKRKYLKCFQFRLIRKSARKRVQGGPGIGNSVQTLDFSLLCP